MAKALFEHKETAANGDIIEIHVFEVLKTGKQPEGVSYRMVFIRNGKRIIGYDNFEAHAFEGGSHHKHIGDGILPYEYVDYWKAIEDFYADVEKWRNLTWN